MSVSTKRTLAKVERGARARSFIALPPICHHLFSQYHVTCSFSPPTPRKFAKAGGYPDHSRAHPEDREIRPKDAARPLIASSKLRSSTSRPAKQLVPILRGNVSRRANLRHGSCSILISSRRIAPPSS